MKRWAMVNSAIQAEELKKRGKFGSGRFPDPNLLIVVLSLHRAIYYFAYFAPFLKEAKGAKAVVEQKKKRGGRGGASKKAFISTSIKAVSETLVTYEPGSP